MDGGLKGRVERFIGRLHREDVNMHGFILTVDGQEKARACYAPFSFDAPHRLYSVSKTMTGIAVGMLIDDGKLSLDDRLADHFKDWLGPDPDPRLTELTIRDTLRMATCYRWTAYREGVDENWAKAFFTGKPTHRPGRVFYYDTGASQALAALVRRLSGQEVIDLLNERLFGPLGCRDERFWLRDPSGCCQGGTGLCMSLQDLHRVAVCLLNGGEGLAPRWYAEEMGKKHIDTTLQTNPEERYGYGWQCWRTRAGWAMYGLGGQLSIVCPDEKTVLTTTADTRLDPIGVQRIYDAFFDEVWPYVRKEDMAPETYMLTAEALPDAPGLGLTAAGPYVFGENQLGLTALTLQKDCLLYENARGRCVLPFARGGSKRVGYPGWPEVPALVSGGWIEKDLLRVRCYAVGNAPCGFDMLLRFSEDGVTVQSRKSFDPVTDGYDGVASGCLK